MDMAAADMAAAGTTAAVMAVATMALCGPIPNGLGFCARSRLACEPKFSALISFNAGERLLIVSPQCEVPPANLPFEREAQKFGQSNPNL